MENTIFNVGMKLFIECKDKSRLETQVIGWEKNVFFLTKAIYIQGLPAKLKNNEVCKIRLLKDGVAYGFESEIVTIQFYPYPLMFFKYPAHVQCVQCRVSPRFSVELVAEFLDASGAKLAEAVVLDISEGGCELKVPQTEGRELLPEIGYTIRFKLMDKTFSTGCCVRKVDKGLGEYHFGMQFVDMTQENKETLTLFLEFLSKYGTHKMSGAEVP